jgi:hypothetical protein
MLLTPGADAKLTIETNTGAKFDFWKPMLGLELTPIQAQIDTNSDCHLERRVHPAEVMCLGRAQMGRWCLLCVAGRASGAYACLRADIANSRFVAFKQSGGAESAP